MADGVPPAPWAPDVECAADADADECGCCGRGEAPAFAHCTEPATSSETATAPAIVGASSFRRREGRALDLMDTGSSSRSLTVAQASFRGVGRKVNRHRQRLTGI
jgi:hypothetical protein